MPSLFKSQFILEVFLEITAQTFWLNFKSAFLKQNRNKQLHRYWVESIVPSKMEKKGSKLHLTLQAPSDLHKKWLQENLLEDFYKHIHQFYRGICQIQLEIAPCLPFSKLPAVQISQPQRQSVFFNPDYTFENFIVGKNNHLAYGACQAVAKHKRAGENLNPLFIYGPSGLGKTHLLNAIGQQNLKSHPQNKVLYLSAERFLNEYITSIQNKQMNQFRKKFRKSCDLLLMDDIQIIARGKGVQEEFFHTFNELYSQKTQIVVCCDQSPGNILHLEERIKTRLEGGLMVDISYPDKETRLAILRKKTKQKSIFLSSQSLDQIAHVCKRSVREMEGVLNKIKIMTELHEGCLSFKDIEKILKTIQKELNVDEIQKNVAKAFGLSKEELRSPSRRKQIVKGRQTAMYLIRINLRKSLNDIGSIFGKKDHTTVLNSLKKVEKLKSEDRDFKRLLEFLQKDIHQNYQS